MDIIDTYYEILGDFDAERLRAILAPDLDFEGSIAGRRSGADAFIAGAAGFAAAARTITMLQREPTAALYDAELPGRHRALRGVLRGRGRPHPDAPAALRRGAFQAAMSREGAVLEDRRRRPRVSRPSVRRSQIMSQCTDGLVGAAGLGIGAARARGGRCRRSSRRTGSRRSGGRCRSWCRCRARRGSGRPRRSRASPAGSASPRSACALTTRPSRNSSVTSSTTTPRGELGIVKRITPSADVLVRPGEDLARRHVALAVGVDPRAARRRSACRSVPGRLDADLARRARAARSAPPGTPRSSPQAATGSSRSRNSARVDEVLEARACPSPPAGRRRASATA